MSFLHLIFTAQLGLISKNDDELPTHLKEPSRITECARYFKGVIKDLKNPNSFSAFLRDYTQFIVIVADDYPKAWDLFIGLNGKGMPLNPTDLVKAFVCGASGVGTRMGRIWEEDIVPLKTDSSSFLLFLCRYKTLKYLTENNLFKEFEKLFRLHPNETPNDIQKLSKVFHWFWIMSIEDISKELNFKFLVDAQKSLRVLRDLDRRDFTTLIFQYADAFGEMSIFDEGFLKLIVSYQIRMAISRKKSRERKFITWFKDIKFISQPKLNDTRSAAAKLLEDKQQALLTIAEILKKDAPDDTIFEGEIKAASYENKSARLILRCEEEGNRGDKTFTKFELEHLMPQTGTDFWFSIAGVVDINGKIDKDAYESIVNNIGNLFICDGVTNKEARNKPFNDKKTRYQDKLKDWSIARITSGKTEWKPDDIRERASQIAKWAKDYWKL